MRSLTFFTVVLLKQDWPELVVNAFTSGMISENLRNSCITYTRSGQFLGTLCALGSQTQLLGTGRHWTFRVRVPPWLLGGPGGAGGPNGVPGHQEGHRAWEEELDDREENVLSRCFFL